MSLVRRSFSQQRPGLQKALALCWSPHSPLLVAESWGASQSPGCKQMAHLQEGDGGEDSEGAAGHGSG